MKIESQLFHSDLHGGSLPINGLSPICIHNYTSQSTLNTDYSIVTKYTLASTVSRILWVHINATKAIPKKLLVKSSENGFILVPAFYLIMCLMKAPKNFEKIAILKIWELVSLGGGKTHFGKLALKWCIFRHEEIFF